MGFRGCGNVMFWFVFGESGILDDNLVGFWQ